MTIDDLDIIREKYPKEDIGIPYEVVVELDGLKNAPGRPGFEARNAIKFLEKEKGDKVEYLFRNEEADEQEELLKMKMDDLILKHLNKEEDILLTNDKSFRLKAVFKGYKTEKFIVERKMFVGAHTAWVTSSSDKALAACLEKIEEENYANGEYVFIKQKGSKEVVAILRKELTGYTTICSDKEKMKLENLFFKVESYDEYQNCAIDSLINDEFTILTGGAGTGKTLLSLAYSLNKVFSEGIKLHVFINPVKLRGSKELGYYSGNRNEKLLQESIGTILINKIGDRGEVIRLIEEGKIILYPFSDIRGVEINKGDIMYITEAQNLSVDLARIAIERCAEGSKIIMEGDPYTQVDDSSFSGSGSGLLRAVEKFQGVPSFGHVHLKKVYRGKFTSIAATM